jgi:protein tyrosine phosphatase (PTP) superfamily phosphohydrolase (DUF442 family)
MEVELHMRRLRHAILPMCAWLAVAATADERAPDPARSEAKVTTSDIFNFRKVDERVGTGGQPTEAQLRAAAAEGYQAVINLATFDPKRSLPDEAGLVSSLGMTYYPIPVDWEHPTEADFQSFERTMQSLGERKTLVHCQANFRVTAFYSLYARKHLGWSRSQAEAFRLSVWRGASFPAWTEFISSVETQLPR